MNIDNIMDACSIFTWNYKIRYPISDANSAFIDGVTMPEGCVLRSDEGVSPSVREVYSQGGRLLKHCPNSKMYSYNSLPMIKQRLSIFNTNSIINLSTSSLSKIIDISVHVAQRNVIKAQLTYTM